MAEATHKPTVVLIARRVKMAGECLVCFFDALERYETLALMWDRGVTVWPGETFCARCRVEQRRLADGEG